MKLINNVVTKILFLSFLSVSLLAVSTINTFATEKSRAAKSGGVTLRQARAIALKKVPGRILSGELETEKGIRVYSFDIRDRKGKTIEVWVSAKSGRIVHKSTESAADERNERREEKNEGKH